MLRYLLGDFGMKVEYTLIPRCWISSYGVHGLAGDAMSDHGPWGRGRCVDLGLGYLPRDLYHLIGDFFYPMEVSYLDVNGLCR